MTKIKFCGLSRPCDIEAANELGADYIGFVFWPGSKRYVTIEQAAELKKRLSEEIKAVGVFVDEAPERVADLLERGVIDIAQLHGKEDESYIERLRELTDHPIIRAVKVKSRDDLERAAGSTADYLLLDAGAGDGAVFDWSVAKGIGRPYFLAGGLAPQNAREAIRALHPYAVDVSSGIETDGRKDREKMAAFADAVRKEI